MSHACSLPGIGPLPSVVAPLLHEHAMRWCPSDTSDVPLPLIGPKPRSEINVPRLVVRRQGQSAPLAPQTGFDATPEFRHAHEQAQQQRDNFHGRILSRQLVGGPVSSGPALWPTWQPNRFTSDCWVKPPLQPDRSASTSLPYATPPRLFTRLRTRSLRPWQRISQK